MAKRKWSDEAFAAIWRQEGGIVKRVEAVTGLDERNCYIARKRAEEALGIVLVGGRDLTNRSTIQLPRMGMRRIANVTGVVIAFSDAHFTPGEERSPAFLALLELIKALKPAVIVDNGDSFDFPTISRHDPLDDRPLPSVAEELDFVKERLAEIEAVAPKGCILVRCLGNHDLRYIRRLANNVPHFAGVSGFRLEDHFKAWSHGVSLHLNDGIEGGETMVRHRPVNGGLHAAYNSVLKGGINFVHGHLHRGQVAIHSDYRGPRWGVDLGTLSAITLDKDEGKFDYDEDSPRNMCQSFGVLTYDGDGRLLPPELCQTINGTAYFRGSAV